MLASGGSPSDFIKGRRPPTVPTSVPGPRALIGLRAKMFSPSAVSPFTCLFINRCTLGRGVGMKGGKGGRGVRG